MRALVNPVVMRAALLLFAAIVGFGLGLFMIRRVRKTLVDDDTSSNQLPVSSEGLPVHAYHAVIQQLKQQKHELLSSQREERRRAKTSENISAAVLSTILSIRGALLHTKWAGTAGQ